jgi:hypothetical protein
VNVDEIRRGLRLRGPNRATIVLTRVAGDHTALFVEPVADTP